MKIEFLKPYGPDFLIVETDKISVNGKTITNTDELEEVYDLNTKLNFTHNLEGSDLMELKALMCEHHNVLHIGNYNIHCYQIFVNNDYVIADSKKVCHNNNDVNK